MKIEELSVSDLSALIRDCREDLKELSENNIFKDFFDFDEYYLDEKGNITNGEDVVRIEKDPAYRESEYRWEEGTLFLHLGYYIHGESEKEMIENNNAFFDTLANFEMYDIFRNVMNTAQRRYRSIVNSLHEDQEDSRTEAEPVDKGKMERKTELIDKEFKTGKYTSIKAVCIALWGEKWKTPYDNRIKLNSRKRTKRTQKTDKSSM